MEQGATLRMVRYIYERFQHYPINHDMAVFINIYTLPYIYPSYLSIRARHPFYVWVYPSTLDSTVTKTKADIYNKTPA